MSERLSRKKVSQFIGDAASGNDACLLRCADSRRSTTVATQWISGLVDQSATRRVPHDSRRNRADPVLAYRPDLLSTDLLIHYFFVTSGMCFDVVSTNDTGTPLLMRCETSSASQFVSRTQPCDEA